jgi:hypothetical protein
MYPLILGVEDREVQWFEKATVSLCRILFIDHGHK